MTFFKDNRQLYGSFFLVNELSDGHFGEILQKHNTNFRFLASNHDAETLYDVILSSQGKGVRRFLATANLALTQVILGSPSQIFSDYNICYSNIAQNFYLPEEFTSWPTLIISKLFSASEQYLVIR